MKKINTFLKDRTNWLIILISAAVALLIHFPEMLSLSDIYEQYSLFPGMRPQEVVFEVVFTFISLLILFIVNSLIFRFKCPAARIGFREIAFSFLLTWILSNLLGKFFVFLHHHYSIPAIDAMVHHYLHPLRDFIITTIVTGSCYIICLIRQKQRIALENQQLRTENLLGQYESLKQQLNPHMLFNSLNTLRSLVREDPARAQDYIQELSIVLRYTLQGTESQRVLLSEEMEFVKAYIFLQKMRYEDNLTFVINVNAQLSENVLVPPMGVQLLIENAIKHNEISNRNPLTISIKTESDGWLSVSNPIQPKLTQGTTTGIGLENLNKRYQLLFKKEIQIVKEKGLFYVRIPLIRAEK